MVSKLIGQVLLDQYRVDEYVASGGMATVFKVRDLKRNVPLAMKVLQTDLAEDPSMLTRFQREARALKKLIHPHIVPFYGLFHTDDFYFLLELYIDGPSLKDVLRKVPDHALSLHDTLVFAKALCAALGYAHANDVIHCDIKPGNVMIDRGGNIYLTDFGIARHSDSTATSMAGAGTAAYMAPEQVREEPVTPATDIYSLGLVIFELLTGRRPFRGDEAASSGSEKSTAEVLRNAHLNMTPPDPGEFRPDLPKALSLAILKALSKRPDERFLSTMDFFNRLCETAGIDPGSLEDRVDLHLIDYKPASPMAEPTLPEPSLPKPAIRPNVRQYWWIPIGIVAVALLAFLLPRLSRNPGLSGFLPAISPTDEPTPESLPTATISTTFTPPPAATETLVPTLSPTVTSLSFETKLNSWDSAEMIFIPAGRFWMGANPGESPIKFWGAEAPRHQVDLGDYWIYRTEVTNQMYARCVHDAACPKPEKSSTNKYPNYYGNPDYMNYPVVNVTWTAAQSYCVWARGRLPSEAEWEKAARGYDQRWFPWGNEMPDVSRANFCDVNCSQDNRDVSQDDGYAETAPIGNYPAGASYFGALDMGGNVWEWVYDWFNAGYYQSSPEKDPPGPASGTTRVIRGGSWFNPVEGVQTVVRSYLQPTRAYSYLGFRCAANQP